MATHDTDADVVEGGTDSTVVGDLDENIAGLLCYAFGWVSGLLFLLLEEENEFVRFHAAQSVVVFVAIMVLSFGLSFLDGMLSALPFIGFFFSLFFLFVNMVLGPAILVVWLFLMYKAYEGERFEVPVLGDIAADIR